MTTALLFDAEGHDTQLDLNYGPLTRPPAHQLLWVDLEGIVSPEQLQALEYFNLTEETLRHLQSPPDHKPFLVQRDGYVEMVVQVACSTEQFMPLVLVAGENFVVSSHPEAVATLMEFRDQVQGETQLGKLDSAAFLAVLLSRHLESYFEAVGQVEAAADRLDIILLKSHGERDLLNDLVNLRRQVSRLRQRLAAHRPTFMHLASPDFVVFAGDGRETQLTSLLLQFDHAVDSVAHSRDLVLGSFDLYMTAIDRRTNDIMKVLTVFTIILGILAAVAGFMGMNFQADIFKSGNSGFRDVMLLSAAIILTVLGLSRWRKWI